MPVSKAQQKAVSKYMKENYDVYQIRMPKGHKASDKASAAAEALGYSLDDNETFVCPFERITWICRAR